MSGNKSTVVERRVELGAMAEKIRSQLVGTYLRLDEKDKMQRDADAITRLHLKGFLSDVEASRARTRLAHHILERILQTDKEH